MYHDSLFLGYSSWAFLATFFRFIMFPFFEMENLRSDENWNNTSNIKKNWENNNVVILQKEKLVAMCTVN